MYTIDEINEMLNEIADEIPQEFFEQLNGGVVLSHEVKMHPADEAGNLYTLGEYHRDNSMGRYIVLYYGSFMRAYGMLSAGEMRQCLKKVLLHEFTHHVESLAGERGLEIKDAREIEEYRRQIHHKQ